MPENQLQSSYFKFHIEKGGAVAQDSGREISALAAPALKAERA